MKINEMQEILIANGVQGDRVIGATFEGVSPSKGIHVNRADEILEFCNQHAILPENTCAIDDNPIGTNYPGYFFFNRKLQRAYLYRYLQNLNIL